VCSVPTNYPDALIYEWESSNRDHPFANTIWNALAHGSYNYSACSGLVTFSNSNTKSHKKNKKTFDVTLPSVTSARLVMNFLKNLIQNVGPIGGHDPLTQIDVGVYLVAFSTCNLCDANIIAVPYVSVTLLSSAA
jgi:hypothetical protein